MELANRVKTVPGGIKKVQNRRSGNSGKDERRSCKKRQGRRGPLNFWRDRGLRGHGLIPGKVLPMMRDVNVPVGGVGK